MLWFASLVGTVIVAVVVSLAVTYSQHAVNDGNPPARAGPPLRIIKVIARPQLGQSFVFPAPLDLTSTDLSSFDANETRDPWTGDDNSFKWAWSHGGAADGDTNITLILQGNRNQPIRILNLQPIEQCGPPLRGTMFFSPPAGVGPTVQIGFDLDNPNLPAEADTTPSLASPTWGGSFFLGKTITLSYGEQIEFQIDAWTSKRSCTYQLKATIQVGATTVTQIINNGTQPFRSSAQLPLKDYAKLYAGGVSACTLRWEVANPADAGNYDKGVCIPAIR